MAPESKGSTPAGRAALAGAAALDGSKVTVWLMLCGLVHLTVSPALMVTVSGMKRILGDWAILTSTVLPCAKAGVMAENPKAANSWAKARRSGNMDTP